MKTESCLLFLLLFPFFSWAQYQPDKVSNKLKKWYQEAIYLEPLPGEENRNKTLELLEKAVKKDSKFLEAYLLLAKIHFKAKEYELAIENFKKAEKIDPNYFRPSYPLYARAAAGEGQFEEALNLMEQYLTQPNLSKQAKKKAIQWKKNFEFGLESARKKIPFNPINLGDSINSKDAEYFPSLTIDGKILVFTRNIGGGFEDFYESQLLADSSWSQAHHLSSIDFGSDQQMQSAQFNKGTGKISQDGKILLFALCNSPTGMGGCDIYYSYQQKGVWSRPYNIGSTINTTHWESQPSLSPDQRDLYFVSNRPGGKGGSDLYVSHIQANGQWGPPENLGDSVNTAGDEDSPFIHADNNTLYFASDGWQGVGDMDLFYTRKKPDGTWTTPKNLGFPINTIDKEGGLFVDANGETAYFSSNRMDTKGQLDLYKFKLYPEARPTPTLFVHGKVYNKKNQKAVEAILELRDLFNDSVLTTIPTNSDGTYLIPLPVGKDYAFHVSKPGYLFHSENFSLNKKELPRNAFLIDIPLQPIAPHTTTTLRNIFFDVDQTSLKPESHTELDKIVELLKKNPELRIQINGYTDSTGSAEHNMELSQGRAESVVHYLRSKGISETRLLAKGFGENNPVASNDTEEGRSKNRRTELEIIN